MNIVRQKRYEDARFRERVWKDFIEESAFVCSIYENGSEEFVGYAAKIHLQEYLNSCVDRNSALFVIWDVLFDRLKISGVEFRMRRLGRALNMEKIHPHKCVERWLPVLLTKECQ